MRKEKETNHYDGAPTLFVGVGGTGSEIIRKLVNLCSPEEKRNNVNFIVMDTNVNDLLDAAKQGIASVQTSNTMTVGNFLDHDNDALQNWFPKNSVVFDKTVSEGAGQVRAISRLALNATIKTLHLNPLYDQIDDLFRKTGEEMKQAMRVVIVSTASGGTGSGMAMLIAMLIRDYVGKKYPNTGLIVRSLILLPETLDSVISSAVEKESQRRNAYATIKEINAFMMKGSGFLDIEGELNKYSDLHIDVPVAGSDNTISLSLLPYDFCFLMDGQDAEDKTLVSKNQYMEQAALALYEQNIGPMQKSAFSIEDNIIKELSNKEHLGRNRFGGIGASVVRYPYNQIAEYLAYSMAIDSIGGEGDAAKWSKYDNEFNIRMNEAKKKGVPLAERPKRNEVYCNALDTAGDRFSKDIRARYLSNVETEVDDYITEVVNFVASYVKRSSSISGAMANCNMFRNGGAANLEIDDDGGRTPAGLLNMLRTYHGAVNANLDKVATSAAELITKNEEKTILKSEPYTLEALIKDADGKTCHPNAIRYRLYYAETKMREKVEYLRGELGGIARKLKTVYGAECKDPDAFGLSKVKKDRTIESLDDLCGVSEADFSALRSKSGIQERNEKLREHFGAYATAIDKYCRFQSEEIVFSECIKYIEELSKEFEKFYNRFKNDVAALEKRKDDCVDALRFTKGDSVYNVCAERSLMDELYASISDFSAESALLDDALNADLFDAAKNNVMFKREIMYSDYVEENRSKDLFDDILIGYFIDNVKNNCSAIDMNIIEALAKEKELRIRIQERSEQSNPEEKGITKVPADVIAKHIRHIVDMGLRLASPSIQRMSFVEAREIHRCAYNTELLEMRQYKIRDIIIDGIATPSVSRYELRFFSALYNITPDKLNKFAAPHMTETGFKSAGLYYNAYANYAKNIGPDSTKDLMITTHIDKRWDALNVMPELDLEHQQDRVMHIIQALVYGLVHKAISLQSLSPVSTAKKVYKYENSAERKLQLIVANGTLCDEFYEILDALYINASIVEDMDVIRDKLYKKDRNRNCNFKNARFARDLEEFNIECSHEGPTSLFEIPQIYYNTIPNGKRSQSEISEIVDAVIKTFKDELSAWERPEDVMFLLCEILRQQYELFTYNYKRFYNVNMGIGIEHSIVADTVFRKIKKILEDAPDIVDDDSVIDSLREMIISDEITAVPEAWQKYENAKENGEATEEVEQ